MLPSIKTQPTKPRRKFDLAFKRQAVQHWLASGKSAETIGAELGLPAGHLYDWRKLVEPPDIASLDLQARLAAAQREIRHLREQRDILKKTLSIIAEAPANGSPGLTP
ncbi:MAG TPA: transposase [Verrucomicrobiae bacterium]|nr:transposase [Verrucomicrobiae bacterium]